MAFWRTRAISRGAMRPLALLVGFLAACGGSVCDNAVKAEQASNQKGALCGARTTTVHDAQKCNNNLSKCNTDDLNEINNYGACLNALPACASSNKIQWEGQRDGCINQAFQRISLTCFANIL